MNDDALYSILSKLSINQIGTGTRVCKQWRRIGWRVLLKERLCSSPYGKFFAHTTGFCVRDTYLGIHSPRHCLTIRQSTSGLWYMDYRNAGENWQEFLFHMQVFGDQLGFE
jgi:hypothetical protein